MDINNVDQANERQHGITVLYRPPLKCAVHFFFSLLFGMGTCTAALAFDPAEQTKAVNYSALSEIGIGGYDVADRQIRAFQIPLSYQLRDMKDD